MGAQIAVVTGLSARDNRRTAGVPANNRVLVADTPMRGSAFAVPSGQHSKKPPTYSGARKDADKLPTVPLGTLDTGDRFWIDNRQGVVLRRQPPDGVAVVLLTSGYKASDRTQLWHGAVRVEPVR